MKPTKKLMVQTNDKRTFFTHMKNLPMLIEFAKTFKGRIAVVTVEGQHVLELEDIAKVFCDQNFKGSKASYTVIQNLYPKEEKLHRTRTQILEDAKKIKRQIRDNFLKEKQLTLKQIKAKFKELAVTDACLSTHFTNVRKELLSEGYSVVKLGVGAYRIEKL